MQGVAASVTIWPTPSRGKPSALDPADEIEADIAASVGTELRALGGQRVPGTLVPGEESILSSGQGYFKQIPELDSDLEAILASGTRYWRLPEPERPVPRWAVTGRQPDSWHLRDYPIPVDPGFDLDAALLRALADANAFTLRDAPVRLFGLRGAALGSEATVSDWRACHEVRAVEPNHVDRRCLIGVWRTSDDHLRLFSASTVPQVANMFTALGANGWGTSLLPTGLYAYESGIHNAATTRPQPGALLNVTRYVSLRVTRATGKPRTLTYDPWDPYNAWTIGAGHNLHAAGSGSVLPRFDSSGCQVIRGGYNAERTMGAGDWLLFQQSAGLADASGVPGPAGRGYDYLLLSGLEAQLRSSGDVAFVKDYRRLRPGSSGPRVHAMRAALGSRFPTVLGKPTPAAGPEFDATTAFLVLQAYKADPSVGEHVAPVWRG